MIASIISKDAAQTRHLDSLISIVQTANEATKDGEFCTTFSLAYEQATITLLENGRAVATWSDTNPRVESHLRALVGVRAEDEA